MSVSFQQCRSRATMMVLFRSRRSRTVAETEGGSVSASNRRICVLAQASAAAAAPAAADGNHKNCSSCQSFDCGGTFETRSNNHFFSTTTHNNSPHPAPAPSCSEEGGRAHAAADDDISNNNKKNALYLHIGPSGDCWTGPSLFAAKHLEPGYVRSILLPTTPLSSGGRRDDDGDANNNTAGVNLEEDEQVAASAAIVVERIEQDVNLQKQIYDHGLIPAELIALMLGDDGPTQPKLE
jgi:hypothetical protein